MRNMIRRLERGERCWPAEIALRSLGLLLLGLCWICTLGLSRLVHQPPAHAPRPIEFVATLLTFLGWSLGCALLAEGAGLFRRVPVPERYRRFSAKGFPQ